MGSPAMDSGQLGGYQQASSEVNRTRGMHCAVWKLCEPRYQSRHGNPAVLRSTVRMPRTTAPNSGSVPSRLVTVPSQLAWPGATLVTETAHRTYCLNA